MKQKKLLERVNQINGAKKQRAQLLKQRDLVEQNILSFVDMGYEVGGFEINEEVKLLVKVLKELRG